RPQTRNRLVNRRENRVDGPGAGTVGNGGGTRQDRVVQSLLGDPVVQHHQELQPGPPELRVEPSLVVTDLQTGGDRIDVRHDFILTGEREASLLVLARRSVGGVIPHTHSPVEIRNGSSRAKPNTAT